MAEGGTPPERNKPGYAALVVNLKAAPDIEDDIFRPRPSASEDFSNLLYIFNKLGLECINQEAKDNQNLTVRQWDHSRGGCKLDVTENCCLHCKIKSKDHSGSKCFLLAISSHGRELTETEIMCSDGESIKLTEILDALSDEKCPSLKGVPRIIFLLVCRGNFKDPERNQAMQDHGAHVNVESKKGQENQEGKTNNGENPPTARETTNTDPGPSTSASNSLLKLL